MVHKALAKGDEIRFLYKHDVRYGIVQNLGESLREEFRSYGPSSVLVKSEDELLRVSRDKVLEVLT